MPRSKPLVSHSTADEMDEKRQKQMAYEYLCRLQEAKEWIETYLDEELPSSLIDLEESLRNGVYLARIANSFAPDVVPATRIFDLDQQRYHNIGLKYNHTDNTVQWLKAMEAVGLPKVFFPETTDVYDKKNMPKAIYCLHALSFFLHRMGIAPAMQDLFGKMDFPEEELTGMAKVMAKYGIDIPSFSRIGGVMASELPIDEAEMHAAVIAVNEAVDSGEVSKVTEALRNPSAGVYGVNADCTGQYMGQLGQSKDVKSKLFEAANPGVPNSDADVYDRMLTQKEIQGCISTVNADIALAGIEEAIMSQNENALIARLTNPDLDLDDVRPEYCEAYMLVLTKFRKAQPEDHQLSRFQVQEAVNTVNDAKKHDKRRGSAVKAVNNSLESPTSPNRLVKALQIPELEIDEVMEGAAQLYWTEMRHAKVRKHEDLNYDEIVKETQAVSDLIRVNRLLTVGNADEVFDALKSPTIGVALEPSQSGFYFERLASVKKEKKERGEFDDLTSEDIKAQVAVVNRTSRQVQFRAGNAGQSVSESLAIQALNHSIQSKDPPPRVFELLASQDLGFDLDTACESVYVDLLVKAEEKKGELIYIDVEKIVNDVNQTSQLNRLITLGADENEIFDELQEICPDIASEELKLLYADRLRRSVEVKASPLTAEEVKRDVQVCNDAVATNDKLASVDGKALEQLAALQAHIRGYLLRKRYSKQRKSEEDPSIALAGDVKKIVLVQACVRMWLQRKHYTETLETFRRNEPAVRIIQRRYREYLKKKEARFFCWFYVLLSFSNSMLGRHHL